MMLNHKQIERAIADRSIVIDPFGKSALRPASYTLHLGSSVARLQGASDFVDVSDYQTYPNLEYEDISNGYAEIRSGGFLLAGTREKIGLSNGFAGTLKNLTGLSRLGIDVQISSLISPGFGGEGGHPLTLEIRNASNCVVRIPAGARICHLVLFKLSEVTELSYPTLPGAHSSPVAPSPSRYFEYLKRTPGSE